MTKTNDQDNVQADGGESGTPTSGVVIVQQQPVNDQQQHFVLSAVNNSAPMIITTPLGNISQLIFSFSFKFFNLAIPSVVTQHLPTTINNAQQQTVATSTNTPVVPANTTGQNKTTKSPTQERLVCSLCNKVYRSAAGLRYHKRKRHRGKKIEEKKKENSFIYHAIILSFGNI
jgi:broad specificity polyphosphatase/5'/3'-nucleotidase SurE